MMFSTTLVAAVTGLMSVAVSQPNWQTSYRAAVAQAAEQHKPMAVFISQGENGQQAVIREGTLSPQLAKALTSEYVPVYVNTATESGAALAVSFGISRGVVVSDRTGAVQAVRHEGAVSQAQLEGYLKNPAPVAVATVTAAPAVVPASYAPVYAPSYAPAISYGGCASGRCPNAR